MKVLVLMGSPRKKDSYNVCKMIEDQINIETNVEFEYLYLRNMNIQDCKGCDLCFKKGEKYCSIDDDLKIIKQKMLGADGIIFACPVYAYQVTAPFKRMIDRFSYLFHRQELIGKPALIVVTTGGGGQKQVKDYLKMTACGWGCNLVNSIEVISPKFFKTQDHINSYTRKYIDKTNKQIKAAAEHFLNSIVNKKLPSPSLYNIFMFNALRSKTYFYKVDYDYWKEKGWLDAEYYYNTHINLFYRMLGLITKKMIQVSVSKAKVNG